MASLAKKLYRRLFSGKRAALASLGEADRVLVEAIRRQKLTYLPERKLASIANTCREVEARGLDGGFYETGCALGGSTILIASIKSPARPLSVYDVFGMIPAPGQQDGDDVHKRYDKIASGGARGIDGDDYYGYEDDLLTKVKQNLRLFEIDESDNVTLIEGLVQNTLSVTGDVAFAHIDVDWYEPVMVSLERLVPNLVVGGSIILDDYHDWSGCRKATDEYFAGRASDFCFDESAGSLKITRV